MYQVDGTFGGSVAVVVGGAGSAGVGGGGAVSGFVSAGGAQFPQELIRARKNADGGLSRENLGGVVFVPMKDKRGWKI